MVAYRESCRTANTLIMDSRKNFYAELISNAFDNTRSLWRTVNGILHPNVVVNIVGLSSEVLADYFISKVSKTIQTIRDKVNILHIVRCSDPRYEGKQMDTLTLVPDNEVRKLISSLPNKTSPLDLMPTNVLKLGADILSPFIVPEASFGGGGTVAPRGKRKKKKRKKRKRGRKEKKEKKERREL